MGRHMRTDVQSFIIVEDVYRCRLTGLHTLIRRSLHEIGNYVGRLPNGLIHATIDAWSLAVNSNRHGRLGRCLAVQNGRRGHNQQGQNP